MLEMPFIRRAVKARNSFVKLERDFLERHDMPRLSAFA